MGDQDEHFNEFLEDDGFCAEYGINKLECYIRKVYKGRKHDWGCFRRAMYDFAQLVFK